VNLGPAGVEVEQVDIGRGTAHDLHRRSERPPEIERSTAGDGRVIERVAIAPASEELARCSPGDPPEERPVPHASDHRRRAPGGAAVARDRDPVDRNVDGVKCS